MRMMRPLIACLTTLTVLIVAPGSAGAATQIGHTLMPTPDCSPDVTWLQSQYSAPSNGVITSWSYQAGPSSVPQLKFKVGRPVSGSTYEIVGESGVVSPAASTLSQYPVRIPVQAGDLIGFYTVTGGACDVPNPSFDELVTEGDLAIGGQASFITGGYEMDVSASLEPDADHDGFGDETQDQCPTNAGTQGPCPVTPVTAKKKKCKKHKKKHHSAQSAKKKCKKKKH